METQAGLWTEEMDALLQTRLDVAAKVDDIVRFFSFAHLREGKLRDTSRLFAYLAHEITERVPRCAERTAGLRKLLEAKDCAVRACLP